MGRRNQKKRRGRHQRNTTAPKKHEGGMKKKTRKGKGGGGLGGMRKTRGEEEEWERRSAECSWWGLGGVERDPEGVGQGVDGIKGETGKHGGRIIGEHCTKSLNKPERVKPKRLTRNGRGRERKPIVGDRPPFRRDRGELTENASNTRRHETTFLSGN